MNPSLCFPDGEKSCFACCPPIRPSGYVHADHENIIKRMLRENTTEYDPGQRDIKPIQGFSCWALGYIDAEYKKIGCLLHPEVNNGRDLRYRIDYGAKCARESCQEAKVFSIIEEKQFWLNLTSGMNSFEYSNPKTNLIFRMLGWGNRILGEISGNDKKNYYNKKQFLKSYPFFDTGLSPRGHSFPLNQIIKVKGPEVFRSREFKNKYEIFSKLLEEKIKTNFALPAHGIFVHKLDIDSEFTDYLRLTLGLRKAEINLGDKLRDFIIYELDRFCKKV